MCCCIRQRGNDDDWRLWLTAAGLPTNLSKQPGVTFDLVFMTVQAAIDGLGVAMGRTSYVQDDIAKGRLVVPFEIELPVDAGFYLVSPQTRADSPKLSALPKLADADRAEQAGAAAGRCNAACAAQAVVIAAQNWQTACAWWISPASMTCW